MTALYCQGRRAFFYNIALLLKKKIVVEIHRVVPFQRIECTVVTIV